MKKKQLRGVIKKQNRQIIQLNLIHADLDNYNDELQAEKQKLQRELEIEKSIVKRMDSSLTHQINMNNYYKNIISYLEEGDKDEEGIPDSIAIDDSFLH